MPVRLRITLFFAAIVGAILILIAFSIYYFSYNNRVDNIRTRLTNRAITTARLLDQYETFNQSLVQKIDSSTTMALNQKVIQVYDRSDKLVYAFSDRPGDHLDPDTSTLNTARTKGDHYMRIGERDVVAHYYMAGEGPIVVMAGAYDEEGRRMLQQLRFILFICFVSGLVVAVGAGYFFSKGLLQPVRKIADEVNEISAHSLARRIATSNDKDEWGYLAATFNELLNRLQESFETQRRFVANASHELSTPLTSISSQLEVSLQRQRNAGDYRRVMMSVYQDVHNLGRLVQTLLELSKASGTAGGLEIKQVRIDEVVMRIPGDVSKTNVEYSILLDFKELPEEEDRLLVFGNEDLLYTAIKNIIINACKYSGNMQARVTLSVGTDWISVTVTDEGKGIASEDIGKIFQPFYRTDDSRVINGFGLGLSLATRIVKLHKGEIDIVSEPRKGTVVTIRLPIAGTSAGKIG
ncbi:MAG: HAMP domain-containing sensor histidine kinase [Chitinophagaceae bacterium]